MLGQWLCLSHQDVVFFVLLEAILIPFADTITLTLTLVVCWPEDSFAPYHLTLIPNINANLNLDLNLDIQTPTLHATLALTPYEA